MLLTNSSRDELAVSLLLVWLGQSSSNCGHHFISPDKRAWDLESLGLASLSMCDAIYKRLIESYPRKARFPSK